ncbi:MAG: hypothetical protein KH395_12760 [Bacteroides sp.]|nr:hypothetical protein [Bacteroides sp.]
MRFRIPAVRESPKDKLHEGHRRPRLPYQGRGRGQRGDNLGLMGQRRTVRSGVLGLDQARDHGRVLPLRGLRRHGRLR